MIAVRLRRGRSGSARFCQAARGERAGRADQGCRRGERLALRDQPDFVAVFVVARDGEARARQLDDEGKPT